MTTKHRTVFSNQGYYAGWPANYGMWMDKSEVIRTGFFVGSYIRETEHFHKYDFRNRNGNAQPLQIRSADYGKTWEADRAPQIGPSLSYCLNNGHLRRDLIIGKELKNETPEKFARNVDWTNTDNVLLFSRNAINNRPRSWFYFSSDGGESWSLPYRIPFNREAPNGICARTDYARLPNGKLLMGLTVNKVNGDEGHTAIVTTDGTKWEMHSIIQAPECERCFAIMASTIYLGERKRHRDFTWDALMAVRIKYGTAPVDSALHVYQVNSASGNYRRTNETFATGWVGNPGQLIRTKSGTNYLVYMHRGDKINQVRPHLLCAKLNDQGYLIGNNPPEVLRTGTVGKHDCGYVRAMELPNGKLIAVYYWDGDDDRRTIEQTIWEP